MVEERFGGEEEGWGRKKLVNTKKSSKQESNESPDTETKRKKSSDKVFDSNNIFSFLPKC